jgi:hypothetical protein
MTDERIEEVARRMCTALGLNPDASTPCGVGDDQTPAERQADKSTVIPLVLLYKPLWRLYRWKAAEAIAAEEAIRAQGE